MRFAIFPVTILAAALLFGCQSTDTKEESAPKGTASPTTTSENTGSSDYAKVQEIFSQNCIGCHGDVGAKEEVVLTSYESVMKGGEHGPNVVPGKPKDSLLVKALRGDGVDRMPFKRPPLPEDQIQLVEKWIADGAKG